MTKLMNLNEEIPSEFFIFVDQLNPITCHNFNLIGQFTSAAFTAALMNKESLEKYIKGECSFLPYTPIPIDPATVSPFFIKVINDYRVEYDAESYRKKYYPLFPSRLSAIYAFDSYTTCVDVHKKYGWPLSEIYKFKLQNNPLNRVIKVNMEHVSLARQAYKVSMIQDVNTIWESYWSGFDNLVMELPSVHYRREVYDSGVIWEYLIEGAVQKI